MGYLVDGGPGANTANDNTRKKSPPSISTPPYSRPRLHVGLLVDVLCEIGMNAEDASTRSSTIYRAMCKRLGGQLIWIPIPDRNERDDQIRKDFNGRNALELCVKHGIGLANLYRIAGSRRKPLRIHTEDSRRLLLGDLTDILHIEIGMTADDASTWAGVILRALCESQGGTRMYVPVPNHTERDAQIRADFNGRNAANLCLKHGISRAHLYRIASRSVS
jgi:Mor family transcriptional regulator